MQTVRYRGRSDVRTIAASIFTAAGLSSPTVTWQKSNGYEVVLDDPVAAFVLAQGDFELGDPNTKFGDLFDVPIQTEWQRDTLTSPVVWQEQVFTVDGAQNMAWSVVGKRLRFTGPTASLGNHRKILVHPNTNYQSCSVKSLWWGPSEFNINPTRRPQLGHVHRYVDLGPGLRKRFIAVWSNIFGGPNPEALQVGIWETDGTSLFLNNLQAADGVGSSARSGRIKWANRFTFGATLTQMNLIPPHAGYEMPHNGIPGLITGMTQAGLNSPATQAVTAASRVSGVSTLTITAHGRTTGDVVFIDLANDTYDGLHTITVINANQFTYAQLGVADAGTSTGTSQLAFVTNGGDAAAGMVQVAVPTAADLEDKVGGGLWTPYYPWRVFPYWVKSWVLDQAGVPNVYVKQWPYGLPEPADSGPFTYGPFAIVADGAVTGLPVGVPGLHGVIGAHAHTGSFGEYGNIEFRRLRAA